MSSPANRDPIARICRTWCTAFALATALTVLGGCGDPALHKATDELVADIAGGRANHLTYNLLRSQRSGHTLDAILAIVATEEGSPRYQAVSALADPHSSRGWLQLPPGTDSPGRGLGASTLPARAAPTLLATLRVQDPMLRGQTLLALGSLDEPTPAVVTAVREALRDEGRGVAGAAIHALGMLGVVAAESAADLTDLLGHAAGERAVAIAGALARVSPEPNPPALDALLTGVEEGDPTAAEQAARHLRDLGPRAAMANRRLMAQLHSPRPQGPTVAVAIVAAKPELLDVVAGVLLDQLRSADPSVQSHAAAELRWLAESHGAGMGSTVPAISEALEREDHSGGPLTLALRRIGTRSALRAYNDDVHRRRRADAAR
jgi:hypothetical protein